MLFEKSYFLRKNIVFVKDIPIFFIERFKKWNKESWTLDSQHKKYQYQDQYQDEYFYF